MIMEVLLKYGGELAFLEIDKYYYQGLSMIGFAPDIDQTTPGALRSVTNCLPTINGMAGAPTPVDTIWILDGSSRGCATVETLSSGSKKYLGQGNYLFELTVSGLSLVGTGLLAGTGRA